jgi:hypothetical protein
MSRQVKLVLATAQDSGLPVPLHAFARSLRFLQKVTLEIGFMLAGIRPEFGPGELPAVVHGACDFLVRELHASTPTALLELPLPTQLQLPEPDGDLGERVLATLFELTDAVVSGDREKVPALLPQHGFRSRILDSFKSMCPVAGEDLSLTIAQPTTSLSYCLDEAARKTAQALSTYTRPDEAVEWRQLIGRLVMLRSFPAAKFAVQRGRRALECPYDPEFEERLLEMYGSVVRLTAACLIARHDDDEDEMLEIQGIEDIETIDEGDLVISEVQCGGLKLVFAKPLHLSPSFEADSVIFEERSLGLVAFGDTRSDAETAVGETLCWLWETYAQADEAKLAPDAQSLKYSLLESAHEEAV